MNKQLRMVAAILAFAVSVSLTMDATAQLRKKKRLDKSDAQATSVAPESTQVQTVSFPYDPNLPQFVVVVELFDYSASGQISGGGQAAPVAATGASGESYTVLDDGTIQSRGTHLTGRRSEPAFPSN